MSKLFVVAKDSYLQTVKSLSFIMLLVLPFIFVAIFAVIGFFIGMSMMGTEYDVAVVGNSSQKSHLEDIVNREWIYHSEIQTVDEADKALAAKEIQAYYLIEDVEGRPSIQFVNRNDSPDMNQTNIQDKIYDLERRTAGERLGLNQEELASLASQDWTIERVTKNFSSGSPQEVDQNQRDIGMGIAYFVTIAMFILITNYASIIATSIAQEKGTHIMEILLSCTSPSDQFFGKIIGAGLAILTQIGIYVVLAFALNLFIPKVPTDQIPLPEGFVMPDLSAYSGLIGGSIIMFFLGCFIYIVLAAMFGSFVAKAEDAQKAMTPLMLPLLAGFYIGIFSLTMPQAMFVKVTSYIPIFTPFIMPFRMAAETATTLEVVLSIIGMVVFAVLALILSLRIYKKTVLYYDDAGMMKKMARAFKG